MQASVQTKQGKKNKGPTLDQYIENLDATVMTGMWKPVGAWNGLHGDGKALTSGVWRNEDDGDVNWDIQSHCFKKWEYDL